MNTYVNTDGDTLVKIPADSAFGRYSFKDVANWMLGHTEGISVEDVDNFLEYDMNVLYQAISTERIGSPTIRCLAPLNHETEEYGYAGFCVSDVLNSERLKPLIDAVGTAINLCNELSMKKDSISDAQKHTWIILDALRLSADKLRSKDSRYTIVWEYIIKMSETSIPFLDKFTSLYACMKDIETVLKTHAGEIMENIPDSAYSSKDELYPAFIKSLDKIGYDLRNVTD